MEKERRVNPREEAAAEGEGGREGEKTLSRTRGSLGVGNSGAASAGSGREAKARRVRRVSSVCRGRKKEKARRGGGTRKRRRRSGGRPGIDRLRKGWIFLPLGGGPALEGRVLDSITTSPHLWIAKLHALSLSLSALFSRASIRFSYVSSSFF